MARTDNLTNFLTDVADAIRNKKGTSGVIPASSFDTEIESISGGGGGNTDIEDGLLNGTLAGNYTNTRVTEVNYGVFYGNSSITGFDAPNVTSIGNYSFYNCKNLTSINLPSLKSIGSYAFYGTSVPNIYLPELTTMGSYTFGSTANTKTITLPKLTNVEGSGFRQNTGCTRVDLGAVTNIEAQGLFNMYALVDLIIRTPSVCTLANVNALNGCSKLANIYVPDNLVESYKTASNWSSYASKIKGLSELEG